MFASGAAVSSVIAGIVGGGVASLWLASRLKIPSILLLLPLGVILGPVLGIVDPDEQFGDLLFPLVSFGVGILLFEGGLSLRIDRVRPVGDVVGRLVTLGMLIVFAIGTASVYLLFDVSGQLAAVIGALLVVSGPTVVQPLLRLANARTGPTEVLKWEGIVIDPLGATLAVVMLDAYLEPAGGFAAITRIVTTLGAGAVVGGVVGVFLSISFSRHLVPDHLHNPLALAAALVAFALADTVRPEAGLMATTVLGLVLANQRSAPSRHILEFEEQIGLLVLGALFLVLGARVDLDEVVDVLPRAVALTLILVLVARPAAVFASTAKSRLTNRERAFVGSLAPRGIVAAAVSAVFALEIEEAGLETGPLVPLVFSVILLTVLVYGLAAVPVARLLRVARAEPSAVAVVGAEPWHLEVAQAVQDAGVSVLVFSDRAIERQRARKQALLVFEGNIDGERIEEAAEALGIGTVLVLTDRAELGAAVVNSLSSVVGRANIYTIGDRSGLNGVGVSSHLTMRLAPGFTEEVIDALSSRRSRVDVSDVDEDDAVGLIAGLVETDHGQRLVLDGSSSSRGLRLVDLDAASPSLP